MVFLYAPKTINHDHDANPDNPSLYVTILTLMSNVSLYNISFGNIFMVSLQFYYYYTPSRILIFVVKFNCL